MGKGRVGGCWIAQIVCTRSTYLVSSLFKLVYANMNCVTWSSNEVYHTCPHLLESPFQNIFRPEEYVRIVNWKKQREMRRSPVGCILWNLDNIKPVAHFYKSSNIYYCRTEEIRYGPYSIVITNSHSHRHWRETRMDEWQFRLGFCSLRSFLELVLGILNLHSLATVPKLFTSKFGGRWKLSLSHLGWWFCVIYIGV